MSRVSKSQNSQQKSVLDLHVVTVAFLALKNGFSVKKKSKIFFFDLEKVKKSVFSRAKNATVTT